MGWTASDFERLDPRLFRSFLAVVKTQSFTGAAAAASLTQGAVSQQVARLEERIGVQLFVRVGNKVLTTPAGQLLTEYARAYMEHATHFLEQINEEFESLRGTVRYAMPESCIHSPHFSRLLDRRKSHSEIVLAIDLKPSAGVLADLMNGDIDFGFVSQEVSQAAVVSYPFCFEEYVLLQSADDEALTCPVTLDDLLALPMVVYPSMLDCLNRWIAVYLAESDPVNLLALRVTGEFNDMRGALAMVEGCLGCTVMPRHVAAPALAQGRLREIIPAHHEGAASLAQQMVRIVRLKERHMPARVRRVIQWFLEMHSELRPVPEELLR